MRISTGLLNTVRVRRYANQTIPIREIIFYEYAICQREMKRDRQRTEEGRDGGGGKKGRERGKRRRFSAIARHLDHALSRDSACTTNPCNNLAPRRRVKCANVVNRHESVRKPVELQPPPVIKSEE